MIYKIVNPDSLIIEHSYEAEAPVTYSGPWGWWPHIAVPEGLDGDCVKAERNESGEIVLVLDEAKVVIKIAKVKQQFVSAAMIARDNDIFAQMNTVFGTTDANKANAIHMAWQDMSAFPVTYISEVLKTSQEVKAFADAKILLARDFNKYMLARERQYQNEVEDIQNDDDILSR